MKSEVIFGDEKVKSAFENLANFKDKEVQEQLNKAFCNLRENAYCGTQIPKHLIPKEYFRRFGNLTNLWKYNLPNAWRLIYTIKNEQIEVISVVLEWMDHKEYERRFKY
ncbi:MAG: hypothetical protein WC438_02915 [Candidatus Pacearchaeota archaeon]